MSKKIFVCAAAAVLFAGNAGARPQVDSLATDELQEAVISSVRAQKDAPYAVSNVSRGELAEFSKGGKELPLLFARTPGVLAWSENGVGTGTTYMRIRGAGGSRINVTLDGVPLNSPEDQTVFWANMNSYASLLGSVQIQRGVGSSTNGDGAFGGSVSLATKGFSYTPAVELNASYGSFNTYNFGGNFSTGLLWKRIVLEGAYHETSTDGYVHGTDGRSGSWYGSLNWLGRDYRISYKILGNFENTGQAWNGITAGTGDLSIMDGTFGSKTGIKTYKDIWKAGLGRFNSLYEWLEIGSDNSYTLHRYKMADGSFWPRTTDNFWQTHHILSFSWGISDAWRFSATAHYTDGYGYYDEFRKDNKLVKYGIPWFTDSRAETIKKCDFVRRKGLSQDTYGALANLFYRQGRWDAVAGLSVQQFKGDHFGYLRYMSNAELAEAYLKGGQYKYYDSDATKNDGNAFVKASFSISRNWSIFADLQFRHVDYSSGGYNDKYIDNDDGTASKHYLDIDEKYDFFNPKAGVNFSAGPHRAYASVAVSNREPERNNFTDNGKYPAPKAERLYDFEGGYQYSGKIWRAGANLYYMKYADQLVQTGELSDIGEALTTNIPDSYRLGAEITAGVDITSWLSLEGNAALSRNRLLDFDEYVEDWDNGTAVIHYDDSPLAFSPDAILNAFLDFHVGAFSAVWHSGYVSRMYLDNSGNRDRSLPGYSLSDISLGYKIKPRKFIKEIALGVDLGNVFCARVAQSGWAYSAIFATGGHGNDNRYYQLGFIPAPPFTATGKISLKF